MGYENLLADERTKVATDAAELTRGRGGVFLAAKGGERMKQGVRGMMGIEEPVVTEAKAIEAKQLKLNAILSKYATASTRAQFTSAFSELMAAGFPEYAAKMQEHINNMPDESKTTADVTKSIQWLNDNDMKDLAAILTANPSMVSDVMKAAMKDKGLGDTQFTISTSQVYIDQDDGQQYVIQTDPNKEPGERVTRVDIEDAFAPTKEEILELEAEQELLKNDKLKALDAARTAFKEADALRFQINDFERALVASEEGAVSGVIGKYLPAFNAQTGILNSISNTLGISVINMATFGALSEREMAMAMRTNIDMNLPPLKLREMIIEQMNARSKLMNELYAAARRLSYGEVTYSEYITEVADQQIEANKYTYNKLTQKERDNVTADQWFGMNLAQRKKFVSLRD